MTSVVRPLDVTATTKKQDMTSESGFHQNDFFHCKKSEFT